MLRTIAMPCLGFLLLLVVSLAQEAGTSPQAAKPKAGPGAVAGEMVLVPGATFSMGIDRDQVSALAKTFGVDYLQLFEDEIPKHSVTIGDFYMDKYLVTNVQFKKFTDSHPEWSPDRISPAPHNGNYLKHWKESDALTIRADHPVVNVTWQSAVAYCQWVGKRLPTEAEWEHAARGGRTARFPWGDEVADKTRANFSASGLNATSPVGSYPANGYGLFDMAGNVWEFLADEWNRYPSAPQKDPVAGGDHFAEGQSFLRVTTRRVIRGGSFGGAPVNLWVEYRDSHPPENAREFVGFRCAR